MTKKDYELIARVVADFEHRLGNWFNSQERQQRQEIHAELAHGMANALEQTNPRFDRNKFLQACGIEVTCKHCGKTLGINKQGFCLNCGRNQED